MAHGSSKKSKFRRRSKTSYKRRSAKKKDRYRSKRRSRGGRLRGISLGFNKGSFMPATALCNHTYSDVITLGTGVGVNHYYMSLNNMNDPDPAIGGHRGLGYNQMASLYNEYVVVGVTWKATFYGTDNVGHNQIHGSQKVFTVVGRADDDNTQETPAGLSATEFVESGWKSKTHARHVYAGKPAVCKGTWSAKRHFNKFMTDDKIIRCQDIGGVPGSGPVAQAMLCIGTYADDSSAASPLTVRFEIDYQCLWHEPNDVGQS